MSRNISEICLEIGKTVKRSGASPETCNKVDDLLVEIIQAKNEVYLQGRDDQKYEIKVNQGVTAGLDRFMNELMEYKKHIEGEFIPWNLVESTYKRLKEADNGRSNDM